MAHFFGLFEKISVILQTQIYEKNIFK